MIIKDNLIKKISIFSLLVLTGCSGNSEPREYKQLGAGDKVLYDEALADVGEDNKAAIEKLNVLELNYPKSSKLPEAMTLKMYALYQAKDYNAASAQADKFLTLYPKHRNSAYAYYIKGMASQMQMMDSQRDQEMTEEALEAFSELQKKFPDSEYVMASRDMSGQSINILAVKELETGRFYASRGQHAAAADRYKCVLDKYPNSAAAPEAMYRMVEVHSNLNSPDHAHRYSNMLQQQYPGSPWTQKAQVVVTRYSVSNNQPQSKYPTKYLQIPGN